MLRNVVEASNSWYMITPTDKLFLYIISWETEGHYQYSQTFRWEPEGRYRCTKSMVIAPFWFSTQRLWIVIVPFWLSTDDMQGSLHVGIAMVIHFHNN